MKRYNHNYKNDSASDGKPENTHLWFVDGDIQYYVSSADNTKVYGSNDKLSTRTQIDVDPSDTSGDNKSRDHTIQAAWHDKDNQIIHFLDCDNPGDDFDVWKLDYSSGYGSESVTEVDTSSTYDTDSVYALDIIRHSTSTYALVSYTDTNTPNCDLMDVSSSPFSVEKAFDSQIYEISMPFVIDSNDIYCIMYSNFRMVDSSLLAWIYGPERTDGMAFDGTYYWNIGRYKDTDPDPDEYLTYSWRYNTNLGRVGEGRHTRLSQFDGSTSENPRGLCFDGTDFYAIDGNGGDVLKYNSSWTYQSAHSLDADNGDPWGICWDGTYFWVTDITDNKVYKYNSSFTLQTSYDLDANNSNPRGIDYDGTYYYVTNSDGIVYIYNSSFTLIKLKQITEYTTKGITFNDDNDYFVLSAMYNIFPYLYKYVDHYILEVEYNFSTTNKSTNVIDEDSSHDIPTSANRRGIAFDGDDTLYYTLQKDSDSKYYLQEYTISSSSNSEISEFNIALQLNRNNSGTFPNYYEKAFGLETDVNDDIVYRIGREQGKLRVIKDFSFDTNYTDGSVIAVTDNFALIEQDGGTIEVWEYEEDSDSLIDAVVHNEPYSAPKGYLATEENLGSNQTITLYDDLEDLAFEGYVYERHYKGSFREYNLRSLQHSHLTGKFTLSYSTSTEVSTIVKAILDEDDYLYYDTDSVPSTGISVKVDFDDTIIQDALDILADRVDGIWYSEPDGKIFFLTASDLTPESHEYYGTYDFNGIDPADYTSTPTSLNFLDSATLNDGTLEVVAEYQGHKNILRLQDDVTAAEDPEVTHNETQATSGTREFYIGSNDVSNLSCRLQFNENGVGTIFEIRIHQSDLDYQDSSGWNKISDITDDTWYHIKVQWYADDTFDIYLDGTKEADGKTAINGQTSGVDRFKILHEGDSTDYLYLDAYGDPTNDSDYSVGDNLFGLSEKSGGFSLPDLDRIDSEINYVKIYGKDFITGTAEDEESQRLHGIIEWIGTDNYPQISDTTELDNLAQAILDRTGVSDFPKNIQFRYYGQNKKCYHKQVGKEFRFTFSDYDELSDPEDYIILGAEYNIKNDWCDLLLSNGLLQRQGERYKTEKQVDSNTEHINKISGEFDTSTGHDHDGTDSKQVSHSDLNNDEVGSNPHSVAVSDISPADGDLDMNGNEITNIDILYSRYQRNTDWSFANSVDYIEWNDEVEENTDITTHTSGSDTITIQKSGRYRVSYNVVWDNINAVKTPLGCKCAIFVNGTEEQQTSTWDYSDDYNYHGSNQCSIVLDLDSSDTIKLLCYTNDGGAVSGEVVANKNFIEFQYLGV